MHPDEKALARKMAADSNGKYTAEQIEAQMRLSNRLDMNGKVLEYGTPDQINAATTKPTDSLVSTVAGVIAGGFKQLARPDVGQYFGEGAIGTAGYFLGERYPMAGPAINELREPTGTMDNIKAWINKGWNMVTTSGK
ncbi:hypothetical protein [Cupriavidus sp. TMH.W2]|uniref:hypothetical protein n=1 Tax=Cupriavidus sp. TMH.W2 TaxID=3434465 RepID=UPI003D779401